MVVDRFVSRSFGRQRSFAEIALLLVMVFALVLRAIEMQPTWPNVVRLLFSIASVAFVVAAPYKTIFRRALLAFALESIVGSIVFVSVDLPFMLDHRAQIGTAALAIDDSVQRLERGGVIRRQLSEP